MKFLSAIKAVGKEAGKVLLGLAFGAVAKDAPAGQLVGVDTLVVIGQEILHTDLGSSGLDLTPEQKRIFTARIVEQLILRSPIGHGKKLRDAAAYRTHVEAFTGAFADILNDFDASTVETKDVT